ncbi:MAG: SCP2 sterol-binding domain-containing protein [Moraxellaceae bacterium]|nr:SCP2 sterol-binding domain-containing protein [Moraxellaceae bacterium]
MLPADFRFPPLLARVGTRLPRQPLSLALCLALTVARRQGALDIDLGYLEGRSLRVVVEDLGASAAIRVEAGSFRPASGDGDVCFRATAANLLALLTRREDPDTLFFQRRLRIEGDTELGLTLKNQLDSIEPPAWLLRLLGG